MSAPDTCPNCGAEVPRGARVCPECGADERTGWSEDAAVDRLDLPGRGDFDYEEFVREEWGGGRGRKGRRTGWAWWLAVAAAIAAILLGWVF